MTLRISHAEESERNKPAMLAFSLQDAFWDALPSQSSRPILAEQPFL